MIEYGFRFQSSQALNQDTQYEELTEMAEIKLGEFDLFVCWCFENEMNAEKQISPNKVSEEVNNLWCFPFTILAITIQTMGRSFSVVLNWRNRQSNVALIFQFLGYRLNLLMMLYLIRATRASRTTTWDWDWLDPTLSTDL